MVSALITTTTIPTIPGVYGKITASSLPGPSDVGVVAIVAKASTGPLGVVSSIASAAGVQSVYGAASAVDRTSVVSQMANMAREAGIAGALQFQCVRVGSGGTKASLNLVDSVSGAVGHLDHPYPGVYGNALRATIRVVVGDATQKELVVYDGSNIVQVSRFPATSGDEPAGLATATVGAQYAVFIKTGTGNGILAAITNAALNTAAGVDPTIANGDYTTAFALLSQYGWATLVTDSEATAVHTALASYLDTEIALGRFRTGAVGEPTSVSESTRRTDATALNSAVVRYIGNGYSYPNGDGTNRSVEGFLAAAEQAGRMSTLLPGQPMTWRTIPGANGLVGSVSAAAAIAAGMGYYEYAGGTYRTGAGISTLVNVNNTPIWALQLHTGWKKLEHVATAFGFMAEIGAAWDEVIANPDVEDRPPNTNAGRAALVSIANRTTKKYIDNGWILSGECIVDPAHAPTNDVSYFTFSNLVIALRAERLVLELPFGQP